MNDMDGFKRAVEIVHERLMRLRYHDLQEGLIVYNPIDDTYHPVVKWNLFGYSREELFEGLEDIFNE